MPLDKILRATAKPAVEVTLVMDEEHARYLMGMLRNYLLEGEEDAQHSLMRESIFTAIKDSLDATKPKHQQYD